MRAGEHRVAAFFQFGRAGQVDQQLHRLAGDPMFAVVDVEVAEGEGEVPAAVGIVGEELAEVFGPDLIVMLA